MRIKTIYASRGRNSAKNFPDIPKIKILYARTCLSEIPPKKRSNPVWYYH